MHYGENVERHDLSERVWSALKRLAAAETQDLTHSQAIKRVKAAARSEGAYELPERVVDYYAREYCSMVRTNKKSG